MSRPGRQDLTTTVIHGVGEGQRVEVQHDRASTLTVRALFAAEDPDVYPTGDLTMAAGLDERGVDDLIAALVKAKREAFGPWLSSVA